MSEIVTSLTTPQKSRNKFLITGMAVMILLLGYGAGMMALPMTIAYGYQHKNCPSVFSLNNLYTSIYPGFIQDKTLSELVNECTAYTAATSNEDQGNWQTAYDAYQAYSSTYPNGLYVAEAYEHSAVVVMALLKDQVAQKSYEEALTNLNLITSSYSDTSVSAEAWNLFPATYTSWGTDLREAGDFEKAEQVFNDFKAWVQDNQKTELEAVARNELAETYITWGQALQSQKQWSDALAKLDMAVALDSDSIVKAKAGQVSVYLEWGNELVEQKEFAGAIEKFERAVSLSDTSNGDETKDSLARGRIQWAADLSTNEDFQAALEQLDFAKNSAATDNTKQAVEVAFEETYLAFSNSTGAQARRAMREALIAACKQHKKPDLPIFGLNKDVIHVGIYGIDDQLPEGLAARTPGELHYIACVEEKFQTVQTRDYIDFITISFGVYKYIRITQYRAELLWNVNLVKVDSARNIAKQTFTGGPPPPFEQIGNESGYFYGVPPEMMSIIQWLLSVIK